MKSKINKFMVDTKNWINVDKKIYRKNMIKIYPLEINLYRTDIKLRI